MTDLEPDRARANPGHFTLDGGPVTDEDHDGAEFAGGRGGALYDDGRAVVSTHGVDGDLHARGSSGLRRPVANMPVKTTPVTPGLFSRLQLPSAAWLALR